MRIQQSAAIAAIALGLSAAVSTQEPVDLAALDRIKGEAFARSEVMEHLRYLTDVHGPRLTGSPQFEDAAKWASERLTSYGLSNAHVERWPFGRSWSVEQYSAELLAPHYSRLAAMPLAWSASSAGPVTGEPMLTPLDLDLTAASDRDVDGGNIIAEIPGGARKDEIVMVGAHFDSWHSGTGATDNGAGSAVMIEVMRILKTLNLKLDRTVRIALWGGEEQGLLG